MKRRYGQIRSVRHKDQTDFASTLFESARLGLFLRGEHTRKKTKPGRLETGSSKISQPQSSTRMTTTATAAAGAARTGATGTATLYSTSYTALIRDGQLSISTAFVPTRTLTLYPPTTSTLSSGATGYSATPGTSTGADGGVVVYVVGTTRTQTVVETQTASVTLARSGGDSMYGARSRRRQRSHQQRAAAAAAGKGSRVGGGQSRREIPGGWGVGGLLRCASDATLGPRVLATVLCALLLFSS